jgi:hypothetical protein
VSQLPGDCKKLRFVLKLGLSRAFEWHIDELRDPARTTGHHNNTIGEKHGLRDRVRDENQRRAALISELDEEMAHIGSGELIESRERLIHQNERGVECEGADKADPLLHPAGQFVWVRLGEVAEADRLEEFVDSGRVLCASLRVHVEEDASVGGDRSPRQQCWRLRDESNLLT